MDKNANCCNICWDELHFEKELPAVLACDCQVIYHLHCISFWLDKENTCPMCRKNTYIVDVDSPRPLEIIPRPPPVENLIPIRAEGTISFISVYNRSSRKCVQCDRISSDRKHQLLIWVGFIIFIGIIVLVLYCN
jgi:hypothetical protein